MLPNTPEMVEAHYAVPALNAVLNTLNTRLDAPLLAWQMNHCEARVLITDREFSPVMARAGAAAQRARARAGRHRRLRQRVHRPGERIGTHEYEALLAAHAPLPRLEGPADEWDAIAVSYTSGTTGDPKGVVTHHRGAYLNAVCNAGHLDHAALPALPVDAADVPLQRLVLPVDGGHAGGRARVPAARGGRGHPLCACASTAWTTTAPRPSCTTSS
jgi:acyl-CoA synthetase (AMP-forming)/AMP-acid ligase II